MNADLITELKAIHGKLDDLLLVKTGDVFAPVNPTVHYELVTAAVHVQRAIDWEKSVAEQKNCKP